MALFRGRKGITMAAPKEKPYIPIERKFTLTPYEAAEYFGIGINHLYEMAKEPDCNFTVTVGRKKTIIIRQKLEEYLVEHRAI